VDSALLCHLLFSVNDNPAHGAAKLRFRCAGPVRGPRGPKYYCQKLNMPHYRGLRDVALNVCCMLSPLTSSQELKTRNSTFVFRTLIRPSRVKFRAPLPGSAVPPAARPRPPHGAVPRPLATSSSVF
jgi:hypothetical protein